jgi:hypothetical protein
MCTTVPIHKKMYTTVHINNKAVQQYEKTSLHNSVNKQQLCTTVRKKHICTTVQINNKLVQLYK